MNLRYNDDRNEEIIRINRKVNNYEGGVKWRWI